MSKAIDVSDLPAPFADAIESSVKTYREKTQSVIDSSQIDRPIGWLKGKWELRDFYIREAAGFCAL
jgi:hypothetical protein